MVIDICSFESVFLHFTRKHIMYAKFVCFNSANDSIFINHRVLDCHPPRRGILQCCSPQLFPPDAQGWMFLLGGEYLARVIFVLYSFKYISAMTCDFQQCGILTSVDSDEPVQPPFKLRKSKRCSVSSLTVIEYSSDFQRLWSDCAHAQANLRLCW